MSDTVVVALIAAAATITAQIILAVIQHGSFKSNLQAESQLSDAKLEAKLDQSQAIYNSKIDELSRRVEEHNKMIERTYKLEERAGRMEEQIKTLFNSK